jgi:GH43 family beta-xylosidase
MEFKSNTELIWVEKNVLKLKFDIKLTTTLGVVQQVVYCMYIQHDMDFDKPSVMYISNEEHERSCHSHMDATRA